MIMEAKYGDRVGAETVRPLGVLQDESYVRYLSSWADMDDEVDWSAIWVFCPDRRSVLPAAGMHSRE